MTIGRSELTAWLRSNGADQCRQAADEIDYLAAASNGHFEQAMKNGASANAYRAENETLRKDAARYRWLRAEHDRHDPICHLVWKRNGDRSSGEWVNTARLDASIDLAIAAASDTQPKEPRNG